MIRIQAVLIALYEFLIPSLILFLHQLEQRIQLDPHYTLPTQQQEEEIEYEVYDTTSRR